MTTHPDEPSIRELIARWHRATAAGDIKTILGLMSADVVFLVAGQPPMRGRDAFEAAMRGVLATHRLESSGEIQEVVVSGTLAYAWAILTVTITSLTEGQSMVRTGNALSVLRKQADGAWVVVRDANMLALAP